MIESLYTELKNGKKLIDLTNILKKYKLSDWKKYVKVNEITYNREKVHTCDLFDIYIMTWDTGQKSLIHNHPENGCLLQVLQGSLYEELYDLNLNLIKKDLFETNNINYIDNSIGFHKIENIGIEIAVSLHIYSPPNHKTKYFI